MATMTITMPDDHAHRVFEALAVRHGVAATAPADELEKAASDEVVDFMETVTKHYEAEAAANQARQDALQQAEDDIVLGAAVA
jgi:uncharacterized protein YeaO (DUF488 family)